MNLSEVTVLRELLFVALESYASNLAESFVLFDSAALI